MVPKGRSWRNLLGWSLVVLVGPALSYAAEPARISRDELAAFLEIGWPKKFQTMPVVEKEYQVLRTKSGQDPVVEYAFALIALRQSKNSIAEKTLDSLLENHPEELYARRMRIWLSVSRRETQVALNHMLQLASALPAEPAADEPTAVEPAVEEPAVEEPAEPAAALELRPQAGDLVGLEMSRFLGRVFGFLDGPGASASNESLRADAREQIETQLGNRRAAAFREAREQVIDRYLGLNEQKKVSEERVLDEKEHEREQRLKDLGERKDELGKRTETLRVENDRLKSEVKERLENLARKDRPLATRFVRLDAQVTAMRQQLGDLNAELLILQRRFDNERDPAVRRWIRGQMDLIAIRANQLEFDIAAGTREAAAVAAERNELRRQANIVEGQASEVADQQTREFEDLRRKHQYAESMKKRIERLKPTADSTEVRARSTTLNSFVTYEAFPLEKERQRILDQLIEQR